VSEISTSYFQSAAAFSSAEFSISDVVLEARFGLEAKFYGLGLDSGPMALVLALALKVQASALALTAAWTNFWHHP